MDYEKIIYNAGFNIMSGDELQSKIMNAKTTQDFLKIKRFFEENFSKFIVVGDEFRKIMKEIATDLENCEDFMFFKENIDAKTIDNYLTYAIGRKLNDAENYYISKSQLVVDMLMMRHRKEFIAEKKEFEKRVKEVEDSLKRDEKASKKDQKRKNLLIKSLSEMKIQQNDLVLENNRLTASNTKLEANNNNLTQINEQLMSDIQKLKDSADEHENEMKLILDRVKEINKNNTIPGKKNKKRSCYEEIMHTLSNLKVMDVRTSNSSTQTVGLSSITSNSSTQTTSLSGQTTSLSKHKTNNYRGRALNKVVSYRRWYSSVNINKNTINMYNDPNLESDLHILCSNVKSFSII